MMLDVGNEANEAVVGDEDVEGDGQEAQQQRAEGEPEVTDGAVDGDGDDADTSELREQLAQMREEADRIASLGTGDEQVDAAEKFAEDAGTLDERVGAAARDADDDRGN